MANSETIEKLKGMVTKYEGMMITLRELFNSDDGKIDNEEQKQLVSIQNYIDRIKTKIQSEENANSGSTDTGNTATADDKYEALADTPAVKEFLANIHKSEGGYVDDPNDPGGKTKYGIAEHREWPAFAKMHGLDPNKPELIKDITKKQVDEYYIKSRFEQNGLDKIKSNKVINALFDQSILTPGIIRKNMKRALNDLGGHSFAANNSQFTAEEINAINSADPNKLVEGFVGYQNAYYENLAAKKPKFQKYLKGWKNRTARLIGFNPKDEEDNSDAGDNGNNDNTTNPNSSSEIQASVGKGGTNNEADVRIIQQLLKDKNYGISVDGDCGPKTIAAIKQFQAAVFNGWSDGLISPGKTTWKKLIGSEGVASNDSGGSATNDDQGIQYTGTTTWDPKYTDKRIKTLRAEVQPKAFGFINAAYNELGIKLRVTSALRTIAEQDALYAKGGVTQARGGQSYHNYGLAIDVVEIKNGQPIWSNPNWGKIAAIGKRFGFAWGGDWKKFIDKPHFEINKGSVQDLCRKHYPELAKKYKWL
ncbi:MAG: M15 family metallopeptidase [Saprospiraceae bacterium]|nr:M15 family metallopeptidase [Saprospiraceae bacterium]